MLASIATCHVLLNGLVFSLCMSFISAVELYGIGAVFPLLLPVFFLWRIKYISRAQRSPYSEGVPAPRPSGPAEHGITTLIIGYWWRAL